MPRELSKEGKIRLLKATVENNFSVAELQNVVRQFIEDGRKEKGTDKTPDLEKVAERFVKQSQTLLATISDFNVSARKSTATTVSDQKSKVAKELMLLAKFALKNGFLTIEDLAQSQNETIQPTVNPADSEKQEAA